MKDIKYYRDHAFRLLAYDIANENTGIYPQAVVDGKGKRTERTEWQHGWNACARGYLENVMTIQEYFKTLPDNVIEYLLDEKLRISVEDNGPYLYVLCNDLFYWGCADCEPIDLKEITEFEKALNETSGSGDLLWVCRKRKMRPQTPYYESFSDNECLLFDKCGPERSL